MVLRYKADGTPDASFGNGGVVTGGLGSALDVAVQPDGKLVVGGWTTVPASLFGVAPVARFTASGAPDPTFATDGIFTYDGGGGVDYVGSVLLPANGGIVAVGAYDISDSSLAPGEVLVMRLYDSCP